MNNIIDVAVTDTTKCQNTCFNSANGDILELKGTTQDASSCIY